MVCLQFFCGFDVFSWGGPTVLLRFDEGRIL